MEPVVHPDQRESWTTVAQCPLYVLLLYNSTHKSYTMKEPRYTASSGSLEGSKQISTKSTMHQVLRRPRTVQQTVLVPSMRRLLPLNVTTIDRLCELPPRQATDFVPCTGAPCTVGALLIDADFVSSACHIHSRVMYVG